MTPALAVDIVERRYPVEFTGSAGEYFRIWIVNLVLTIITLGIYSAWAKVRKRRYFYAHTRIDGEGFEYRGNPLAILKGRLIAVGLFTVFIMAGEFFPELRPDGPLAKVLLFGIFIVVGPWLIVKSLKFNAYNTAYRNVRFHFLGTYGTCFKTVIRYIWYTLTGLLYPYFKHQMVKYAAENHAYGTTRFDVADFKTPFIHAYAVAFGLGFLGAIAMGIFGAFSSVSPSSGVPPGLFILAIYGGFFLLFGFVRARTMNAVWNAIRVGPVRCESSLNAGEFIWLYFSNLVAILFTLGLATPWAVIRMLRYRAEKFAVMASGPLDGYAQAEAEHVGAAGEEVGEMLDIDVAL